MTRAAATSRWRTRNDETCGLTYRPSCRPFWVSLTARVHYPSRESEKISPRSGVRWTRATQKKSTRIRIIEVIVVEGSIINIEGGANRTAGTNPASLELNQRRRICLDDHSTDPIVGRDSKNGTVVGINQGSINDGRMDCSSKSHGERSS